MFDTSPHYGNGLSEARFGAVLRDIPRDSYVLSTKIGRWMDPFTPPDAPKRRRASRPASRAAFRIAAVFDYSYDGTMRSIEQSLLRTGLSAIDILMIHDCDVWTHGADMIEQRFSEAMDGRLQGARPAALGRRVKAIGLGVNEADMCERFARAGDFDVMMLAGRYSLLEQPALRSFLPLAQKKGIGIMLAGVFNSGILATGAVPGAQIQLHAGAAPRSWTGSRKIEAVCRAHGVTLRQAALAFAAAASGRGDPGARRGQAATRSRANVADVDVAGPAGAVERSQGRGIA